MSHVGSKTRSLGQFLEKHFLRSKGHIFGAIIMKFGQNVCLDKISKMGYVRPKTKSLDQVLEKPCVCSRGHIFSPIIIKLGQNVCIQMFGQNVCLV